MITFEMSDKIGDLERIVELQQINLPDAVASDQRLTEGFVTMQYTVQELQLMCGAYRHAVAKSDGIVIGYALTMMKDCRTSFPFLDSMFDDAEAAVFDGRPLRDHPYFFMGQICVDKAFRGKGVFRRLYETLREHMRTECDFIVTEVSVNNPRSLGAHRQIGFTDIAHGGAGSTEWRVIAWDWR
ncbi:hypothetical protein LT85_2469 [Collimonas arenae]|uniref:N-acetyltransferase domain-containing protein n=1 Tax=Collimonas arenae TaxID=279058 RepID=A0A0A1FFK1_9BURK|nr:GNAT family N-acetyltransferase [Collimonas arenae]AIY41627.1 hypothetical protein LT85_2469 [Collimonas arenae]